jgi:hypothetical protein
MRKSALVIALFTLLAISACSSSSGATSITPTAAAPRCIDGVCVKNVIVNRVPTGEVFVLFVLTDQDGKVNITRPPQFTQDMLSLQAYQLSDQGEKLAFGQYLPSQNYICWVTNNESWAKGQLSAACGLILKQDDVLVDLQTGGQIRVKLEEFNFEQVVEVTDPSKDPANNRQPGVVDRTGGTRIVLAPAKCSGASGAGDDAQRLRQAAEIIWYRLSSMLRGGLQLNLAEPAVMLDECTITVELSPLGDPTPFIRLIQQPGRFELIDSGSDYHAPGAVLRTTNYPSPTVPISTALQAAIPPKQYDVIATNADLDQLMLVYADGGNSLGLEFDFREVAAQKLAKVTTAHSISTKSKNPYYLCILLDSVVETCASVSTPFTDGRIVVGFGDDFKAQWLDGILRNGELPLELKVIKVETIYAETTN